jgi:hypothetical protein
MARRVELSIAGTRIRLAEDSDSPETKSVLIVMAKAWHLCCRINALEYREHSGLLHRKKRCRLR